MSERFWPAGEAAQAEYERLRSTALTGEPVGELLAARRFARHRLQGLISWPQAEAAYLGSVLGARRPVWSGAEDPREAQLAEAYGFLLARRSTSARDLRAVGR